LVSSSKGPLAKYGYCPGSPFKKAVDAGLGI
jgi:hypothetical protein